MLTQDKLFRCRDANQVTNSVIIYKPTILLCRRKRSEGFDAPPIRPILWACLSEACKRLLDTALDSGPPGIPCDNGVSICMLPDVSVLDSHTRRTRSMSGLGCIAFLQLGIQ